MIRKKFLLGMKKESERKPDMQAGFISIGACDIPAHYIFKKGADMYGRIKAVNQGPVIIRTNIPVSR